MNMFYNIRTPLVAILSFPGKRKDPGEVKTSSTVPSLTSFIRVTLELVDVKAIKNYIKI